MEAAKRKNEIRQVSHLFDMEQPSYLADLTDEELVAFAIESRRKAEKSEQAAIDKLRSLGWPEYRIAYEFGLSRFSLLKRMGKNSRKRIFAGPGPNARNTHRCRSGGRGH